MQPKFTLKNLGFVGLRFFAIAMIIGLTTQFSFSQERPVRFPKVTAQQQAEREAQKIERYNAQQLLLNADNDAGLPNRTPNLVNPNRTEAICTTWNVSITSADPTTGLKEDFVMVFLKPVLLHVLVLPGLQVHLITKFFNG